MPVDLAAPDRQRPTLDDVAERAGVSRATASRVVSGSHPVSERRRIAVMRAVADLQYVPNQAARSLVTHRTGSYALVLPEGMARVFSDGFFPALIRGATAELEESDEQLVILLAGSPAGRRRIEQYARAGHVDGVILASMHGPDPLPEALARTGVAVVCNERPLGGPALPYVGVDNEGGARLAVRYLRRIGRERIATVAGPADMAAGIERLAGYRRETARARCPRLVAHGDFSVESGRTAMAELLRREPGIDGVFAASDQMAAGALEALRTAGRRVPEDVAVVGFDDVDTARLSSPALTTVRQPIDELGRQLVRKVQRLAAGEPVDPALVLPTELVVRDSA
ncbi:LacI family DNA-binding transcriptional regulator [Kitasatospora sp. NPDC059571]|uniref:LacI family DNA-binding transcriptional regulator n=1 Tax=Kitasatospora sp. NPDC059571 TaxID=3346871 RepID=UPI0036ABE805